MPVRDPFQISALKFSRDLELAAKLCTPRKWCPSKVRGAAVLRTARFVDPASSVPDAEKLLAQQARQRGDWTLRCQPAEEAH